MQDDQSAILQLNEAARYQTKPEKRTSAQCAARYMRDTLAEFHDDPSPERLRWLNSAFALGFRVFNTLDPMPEPPAPQTGDLRKVA
jgi:hypothetical protein